MSLLVHWNRNCWCMQRWVALANGGSLSHSLREHFVYPFLCWSPDFSEATIFVATKFSSNKRGIQQTLQDEMQCRPVWKRDSNQIIPNGTLTAKHGMIPALRSWFHPWGSWSQQRKKKSQQPLVDTEPLSLYHGRCVSFDDFCWFTARNVTRNQLNTTENRFSWNKNSGIQVGSCGCPAGTK